MAGFWRAIFNTFTSRDNPRFGKAAQPYDPDKRRLPNVIRQKELKEQREREKLEQERTGNPDYQFKKGGFAGLPGNSQFSRGGDPAVPPDDGEQEKIWGQQGANDQEIETLEELHNRFNTWPSYDNWMDYVRAQEELGIRPDWEEFREKYEGSLA